MSGFSASNSGASQTNYSNDTAMYFLGHGEFTGPPNWSIMLINPTTVTVPDVSIRTTGSSNWTVQGTGGTGKILSITLHTATDNFDMKYVDVVLQAGGGTFTSGGGNTFNPPSVFCFVEGTRLLTQNGYKAIETLIADDRILTSDSKAVPFKRIHTYIPTATKVTAPYCIEPGAFGKNIPATPLRISALHKIQLRKGVWTYPEHAAKTNPLVRQYGIGEPVTYYHIECPNYLQDNIIAEGAIVESFCPQSLVKKIKIMYTYNKRLGGFTRISKGSCTKQI